ncbi:hypothetical protein RABR111495_17495 [Rahnella bruchi]
MTIIPGQLLGIIVIRCNILTSFPAVFEHHLFLNRKLMSYSMCYYLFLFL